MTLGLTKALTNFATISLLTTLSHAATPLQLSRPADATIPFVIIVEKQDYQNLLNQLPEAKITINKQAILKTLTSRLTNEGISPKNGQALTAIASELYKTSVIPILTPRVEKFNDLINKASTQDSVSAGVLAFSGLAKAMSTQSQGHSSVLIYGDYSFIEGQFNQGGKWRLFDDTTITDTTHFTHHLFADIDEDISFDLTPYGKEHSFTWNFSCSGKVEIKQSYACALPKPLEFNEAPQITLRVKPEAKVTASKTISSSSYFSLMGESYSHKSKTFPHPAILEIKVRAKEKTPK